jgi:peptidoglycan hydrolase-like protein with peptidoglycan-binding domain
VEGGRYGIDAHYHGATGAVRAERQEQRLAATGLAASVRTDQDGSILRLGPLAHQAVWLALEAFLGRPMVEPGAPDDHTG